MIEETIAKLEARLQEAQNLTPEQRQEAQDLIARLRSEIATARASGRPLPESKPASTLDADDESVVARLEESVVEFEATHPQLTDIVNRISTVLANMGI